MTVMKWYAQDEVNQDDSEQNDVDGMKKGADSTADAYVKERLVICNEEDTDGRARVTRDEERVLPVDWTEIRLCR